jgi:hypothetical protein
LLPSPVKLQSETKFYNIPGNPVYMDIYGDEESLELKKLLAEVVSSLGAWLGSAHTDTSS